MSSFENKRHTNNRIENPRPNCESIIHEMLKFSSWQNDLLTSCRFKHSKEWLASGLSSANAIKQIKGSVTIGGAKHHLAVRSTSTTGVTYTQGFQFTESGTF